MQPDTQQPSTPPVPPAPPAPPTPPSRLQRILAYRWLHLCALAVFVLDQATKAWVCRVLPPDSYGPGGHIEIIPGFFNIVHVGNTGAAWSILSGRSTLLALFAIVMLAVIFFSRNTLGLRRRPPQIAFGLLCGGIAGNLVDRLLRDHVLDFLDFDPPLYGRVAHALFGWPADSHYPAFNIADCGICAGVALYIALTLFGRADGEKNKSNGAA